MGKTKIWEKSNQDKDKDKVNVRKKISEIGSSARDSSKGVLEAATEDKKLFNKNQFDIIKEANQIMKERSKNSGLSLSNRNNSVYDFILQNKEICLKNYLIDLLKGERTAIAGKQEQITRALNESEKKLEADQNDFRIYMENEKNILQANEKKIL